MLIHQSDISTLLTLWWPLKDSCFHWCEHLLLTHWKQTHIDTSTLAWLLIEKDTSHVLSVICCCERRRTLTDELHRVSGEFHIFMAWLSFIVKLIHNSYSYTIISTIYYYWSFMKGTLVLMTYFLNRTNVNCINRIFLTSNFI